MSELIRESLRHSERSSYSTTTWDDGNAYRRAQAARRGIREQDVDRLVHETRAAKKRAKK